MRPYIALVCAFLHSAEPRAKPQTRAMYGRILHSYVSMQYPIQVFMLKLQYL